MIADALENPSQEPSFEVPPNCELQRAALLLARVEISLAAGTSRPARRRMVAGL